MICNPTRQGYRGSIVDSPSDPSPATEGPRTTEEWLPRVYDELRRLAGARLARESAEQAQTLQPTALVHEAWLRLMGSGTGSWENRRHFFAAAAEAMRRILVERARRRGRLRHGGRLDRAELEMSEIVSPLPDDRLLSLHEALERLAVLDARAAEVVNLRFFLGLTEAEIASQLGVSVITVERAWRAARVWLFREVSGLND